MFKSGDIVRAKKRGRTDYRVVYSDGKGEIVIQSLATRKKQVGNTTYYLPASRERRVRESAYQLAS